MTARYFPIILAAGPALTSGTAPGWAETLRIGGAGAGRELPQELGGAYAAGHPDVSVEIIPSLGTGGKIPHFVVLDKPSAAAKGFAAFLTSQSAARLMRQAGVLPAGLRDSN